MKGIKKDIDFGSEPAGVRRHRPFSPLEVEPMLLNPQLSRIQSTIRFAGTALIVFALVQIVPANLLPALAQDLPTSRQGPEAPPAEDLQERVRSLERTVEDMKKEREAPKVGDRTVSPEVGPSRPTAGTTATVPEHERERRLLNANAYAAARLDNAPFDPELRGFFLIPGTQSMLRMGGFARTDLIHDFKPAGNNSMFVTSSIPTGPNPGNDSTSMSIVPSRLSFEFRSNHSFGGPMRIYYENDFANNPDNVPAFRLRHFYGQWSNVLVGQTWSAFQDADAFPDTVDFKGPNAMTFRLQPLIRYTHAINKENNIALSIEQPGTEAPTSVNTPTGPVPITPTTPLPDFVLKYRYEESRFHIQNSWLFRSLGGFSGTQIERQVFGWGGMLSAAGTVYKRDNIILQGTFGEGIGRYINDLNAGSGTDVGFSNPVRLQAIPTYGGFAAYQHFWDERWRSTATYGYLHANLPSGAIGSDFKQTQYTEGNLMYRPGAGFTIGAALLWGQHVVADGSRADVFRLNFVFQYDLVDL